MVRLHPFSRGRSRVAGNSLSNTCLQLYNPGMEELTKRLQSLVESGRAYSRKGLLYEAAYRYGQAVVVIQTIYDFHNTGLVQLPDAFQAYLAQMHQKLTALSDSLQHSAGNGRHKLSGKKADDRAREGLHNVLQMLREDLAY